MSNPPFGSGNVVFNPNEVTVRVNDYERPFIGLDPKLITDEEFLKFCRKKAELPKEIETKPTNPKDAVGSKKLPLELVPDTIQGEVALAFLEGALKYGRYNWRVSGVRASIYAAALKRHLARWWNGEDADKATRVKHLASVIACAGILLDAELCGKLTDDRPPAVDLDKLLNVDDRIEHLKELFKDHNPKQFTREDGA